MITKTDINIQYFANHSYTQKVYIYCSPPEHVKPLITPTQETSSAHEGVNTSINTFQFASIILA